MRRRELLQAGLAGWGAGFADNSQLLAAPASPHPPDSPLDAPVYNGEGQQYSISIREYLSREALKVTQDSLADYPDAEALRRLAPERRLRLATSFGPFRRFNLAHLGTL